MRRKSRKPRSKRVKKRPPTRKRTKLTDLPEEVIEHISEYLPATSVRALRCVNKYLRGALSSNRVCKRMLYYPERFYLCDMESGSTAPGVAQVVRDLSAGRLRKYQAYEKLQQIRLGLCMNKQFKQGGEILLLSSLSKAQNMVDDHGQHWVFVRNLGKMSIWNITKEPKLHNVVNFDFTGIITLFPAGYIFLHKCLEIGAVYKFQYPKYRLKEYYTFNPIDNKHIPFLSSYFVWDCACDVSGDMIVSCLCVTDDSGGDDDHGDDDHHSNAQFFLQIWRVSDGAKLGEVSLHGNSAIKEDQSEPDVFHGYKSNFLIVPEMLSCSALDILVLNAEARRVTHLVPVKDVESFQRTAYMCHDKVVLLDSSQFLIYTLDAESTDGTLAGGRLTKTIKIVEDTRAQFTGSKLVTRNEQGVLIVNLEEDSLPEVQVTCDTEWMLLNFIEPKLLILAHDNSVKIMTMDGTVLYCGQYEGIGSCCRFNGIHCTEYPSKLIMPCKGKLCLLAP